MIKIVESMKARREALSNEDGFSLIDVVVTVAIIIALSIGGFIAYTGIVDNAKTSAVAGAADQLRTAATVAINDEDPATDPADVRDKYNAGSNGLTAYLTAAEVTTTSPLPTNVDTGDWVTVVNDANPDVFKSVQIR